MDRYKDVHGDGHGAGAARSGHRVRRRSPAKWLSIVALALGALWDAWNVAVLVERGDSPEMPFVSAVLMTAVLSIGTYAGDGILVVGRDANDSTTSRTEQQPCTVENSGILVVGFTGILVVGFTGILVVGVSQVPTTDCGILVVG